MQIRRYHQEIVEESEMEYINLKINGVEVSAPKGSTILEMCIRDRVKLVCELQICVGRLVVAFM